MDPRIIQALVDCSLLANLRHRCLLTALLVQETFGGQLLMQTSAEDGEAHYVNARVPSSSDVTVFRTV